MNLIIDFLNIRDWTVEAILNLYRQYGLYRSLDGQRRGYEKLLESEKFPGRWFYFEFDDDGLDDIKLGFDKVFPGDEEKYQELFDYLKALQDEWGKTIKYTKEHGPNCDFLNYVAKFARIVFYETEDPLTPAFQRHRDNANSFEQFLEFDFIQIFLSGKGEVFKKLKCCKNPNCRKWFIVKRSTRKYCCDLCRAAYHNPRKIESGYLKEYQQKKRDEGHPSYFR